MKWVNEVKIWTWNMKHKIWNMKHEILRKMNCITYEKFFFKWMRYKMNETWNMSHETWNMKHETWNIKYCAKWVIWRIKNFFSKRKSKCKIAFVYNLIEVAWLNFMIYDSERSCMTYDMTQVVLKVWSMKWMRYEAWYEISRKKFRCFSNRLKFTSNFT